MEYVRVASVNDVSEGEIKPVEAGGQKLLLTKDGGEFHVTQRKCPHLGLNLCKGKIEDGGIVCMFHKAKFDLKTGKIARDPKLLFIGMKAKNDLAIYPVRVEGEDIFVGV